jgi:hypothetical protein
MPKDFFEVFELAFHEGVNAESSLPDKRKGLAARVSL